MRHLLDVLRKDFEEPLNVTTSSTELEKIENDLLGTLLPHLESRGTQMKTKEDNDLLPYASLIKHCDTPEHTDYLHGCKTPSSDQSTASPAKTKASLEEGDTHDRGVGSPLLTEHITNNPEIGEEDLHHNQTCTNATSKESHEYTTVTSGEAICDGQVKELEDLGRTFSDSLHIVNNTDSQVMEPENEQHTDVAASVSDDDF